MNSNDDKPSSDRQGVSADIAFSKSADSMLTAVFQALPLAVFCKDYQSGVGKMVVWNRGAEVLWGIPADSIIGRNDFEFFPEDQAKFFRDKDLEILKNGQLLFIESEQADSKTLGSIPVRTWKVPLCDIDGTPRYIVGVSQNISDIKRLEEELKNQSQKAILAARLMQQAEIAKSVTHELNNPLAIVLGRTSQIRRMLNNTTALKDVSEALDSITATVRSTTEKIDTLFQIFDPSDVISEPTSSSQSLESPVKKDFFHDLNNSLAIALGRAMQAKRLIGKAATPDDVQQLEQRIESAIEALKRMNLQIEAESGTKRKKR